MFIEIMGKYPPPLPNILTHEEFGPTKSALDVGCGNGYWWVLPAMILAIMFIELNSGGF